MVPPRRTRNPGQSRGTPRWRGGGCALRRAVGLAVGLAALVLASRAGAVELCSPEAHERMRAVGISRRQIAALCPAHRRSARLLGLSVRRTEERLGYCSITLALRNGSIHHINSFSLTTEGGRFEIFQFYGILPGGTGFATASSRSLLACDELGEVKVVFLWPGGVRVDDRALQGRRLENFKPGLESPILHWKP